MNLAESKKVKESLLKAFESSRFLMTTLGKSEITIFMLIWAKFLPQTKNKAIGFFDVLETLDSVEKFILVRETIRKEDIDFSFFIDNFEGTDIWSIDKKELSLRVDLLESLRFDLLPAAKFIANGDQDDIEKIIDFVIEIYHQIDGARAFGINKGILDFSKKVFDFDCDKKSGVNCFGGIGTVAAYKFARNREVYFYEKYGLLESFSRSLICLYGKPFKIIDSFSHENFTFAGYPLGLSKVDGLKDLALYAPFSETKESEQISDLNCKLIYLSHETTKNTTIAITSPGTLFSDGKGIDFFRKKIIENNWLDAIIHLPAQVFAGSGIQGILMILKKDRKLNDKVQLIDFSNCKNEDNVKRGQLLIPDKEIEDLFKIYKDNKKSNNSILVSLKQIKSNDYKLTINKYLLTEQDKKVKDVLGKRETVPLNSLVSFIRPLNIPGKKIKNGPTLNEILTSDINYIGEIDQGSKSKTVSEEFFSKSNLPLVKKHDLVISIKGTIGKIGLITNDLENTVPGTSLCILRTHESSLVSPIYLFQYLRSNIGQSIINSSSQGVTIPFISIKDLKNLSIPIPSLEERKNATKSMKRSLDLFHWIKKMRDELDESIDKGWLEETFNFNEEKAWKVSKSNLESFLKSNIDGYKVDFSPRDKKAANQKNKLSKEDSS